MVSLFLIRICITLSNVVTIDAEQRTKDFTYPHQHATLEEFVNNIHDPNKIQCILDVAFGQGGLPLELRLVPHIFTLTYH